MNMHDVTSSTLVSCSIFFFNLLRDQRFEVLVIVDFFSFFMINLAKFWLFLNVCFSVDVTSFVLVSF